MYIFFLLGIELVNVVYIWLIFGIIKFVDVVRDCY